MSYDEARITGGQMTTEEMLDALADYKHDAAAMRITWEQERDKILASVKAELDALDAEYEPLAQAAQANIAELETRVREAILQNGHTVKGKHLMAVWNKGRVSWDTKKLDGLMIALPQLAQCRTEGQPSVTIRNCG